MGMPSFGHYMCFMLTVQYSVLPIIRDCCSIHMGLFILCIHIVLHVYTVNDGTSSQLNVSIKPNAC